MRAPLVVPTDDDLAKLDLRQHSRSKKPRQRGPLDRSAAEVDRDRILYSSALKRLAHVTQVTAAETGLSFHSRLTHSLKVAQVAQRLAQRLARQQPQSGPAARVIAALDPNAAEAAALAHDLGHPPFGHLAEQELNLAAASFGGFEGNAQSFRIVTRLALRDRRYDGLNLTRRTLNGLLKYPWLRDEEDAKRSKKWNAYGADGETFAWARTQRTSDRTIEAEIMDWADDVTYAVHDMDDFYRAGLVPLDRLSQPDGVELEKFLTHLQTSFAAPKRGDQMAEATVRLFGSFISFDSPYAGSLEDRVALRVAGSGLISYYIEGATVRNDHGKAVFVIDESLRDEVDALKQLIWFYVINRPSLAILQSGQRRIIRELYEHYRDAATSDEFRMFPALYADRLRAAETAEAKQRAVIDLISGMTEAGAAEVHRRVTGASVASISDPTGRLA
jgi:dGTPase